MSFHLIPSHTIWTWGLLTFNFTEKFLSCRKRLTFRPSGYHQKWRSERIIYWLNRHWNSQCGVWQEAHVFVFLKNIFVIWLACISHFEIFWDKHWNCEIEFHHSRERSSHNGSYCQVTPTSDPSSNLAVGLRRKTRVRRYKEKETAHMANWEVISPNRLEALRVEFCLPPLPSPCCRGQTLSPPKPFSVFSAAKCKKKLF